MPFIGKQPQVGAYSKLDAITTSATATYNLTLNSGAYYPSSANHLMVSLNGVMQAPQDSFTISGATIIFASTLASTDSIDFIMALGDVLDIGTPSDGTVVTAKIQNAAVTTAKLASSLDLSGKTVTYGLTDSDMPSGSVLQVVSATQGGTALVATSSTTFVTTGFSKTITPSATTSKIKIDASFLADIDTTGANVYFVIKRGSTSLGGAANDSNTGMVLVSNTRFLSGLSFSYLDSPSTTSATTYTLYMKSASGGTVRYRPDESMSSLILTEIAG